MSPRKPKDPKDPKKPGRIAQFRLAYKRTREVDTRIGQILLAWFVGVAVVAGALSFLVFRVWPSAVLFGVLFGILAALIVFGRRAQAAALAQIKGKPGAGIATLGILKRGWKIDEQPIAFTKQQDVVTRVVGPPGVVLLGEGNANRLRPLLTAEHKKHARVLYEVPIHEVLVGEGEGEVPLPKLVKHVRKLGNDVKAAQVTDILQRLRALDAQRSALPIPKGPMPTSTKGMRSQMRGNVRGR